MNRLTHFAVASVMSLALVGMAAAPADAATPSPKPQLGISLVVPDATQLTVNRRTFTSIETLRRADLRVRYLVVRSLNCGEATYSRCLDAYTAYDQIPRGAADISIVKLPHDGLRADAYATLFVQPKGSRGAVRLLHTGAQRALTEYFSWGGREGYATGDQRMVMNQLRFSTAYDNASQTARRTMAYGYYLADQSLRYRPSIVNSRNLSISVKVNPARVNLWVDGKHFTAADTRALARLPRVRWATANRYFTRKALAPANAYALGHQGISALTAAHLRTSRQLAADAGAAPSRAAAVYECGTASALFWSVPDKRHDFRALLGFDGRAMGTDGFTRRDEQRALALGLADGFVNSKAGTANDYRDPIVDNIN